MSKTDSGKPPTHVTLVASLLIRSFRIDGALDPWIAKLLEALLHLYPLPPGTEVISASDTPPPRASLSIVPEGADEHSEIPLNTDKEFHTATINCNRRITAADWSQDVRHLEFEFVDNIQFVALEIHKI